MGAGRHVNKFCGWGIVAAIALGLCGPAAADAEKGMAALAAGDFKTALTELNADAAKGDADAMFMLSVLFAEGKGVKQDAKASFEWLEKGAKAGSVRAQGTLGMYYSEGIGTAKDDALSLEWGRRAAESGHLISQFIMGVRFNTGTGVTRDGAQAAAWWNKAAARGFVRAQVMLADQLMQKAGATETAAAEASAARSEAVKWLIVASASGLPGAENLLSAAKEKMTPAEVKAAEEQARDWRPAGAPN